MPNIFNYLKRPEYVFRPRQVLRRFGRFGKAPEAREVVELPWGASVKVHPRENVGSDIFHYGIFDRIVPEAIYRLADQGEWAVEIGANIGQNCSLMAYRTGSDGRVIAFEPHPEIFQELKGNLALWPEIIQRTIQLENVALGESSGEAWLGDGLEFDHNRGSASLCDPAAVSGRTFKVTLRQLDEYLPEPAKVGVCKIDVEGHELSVLKGASRALRRGAIRDVIFEDFTGMPSPVGTLLQEHRYTVFQLTASWWKPLLSEVRPGVKPPEGFSFNYLATLDPERVKSKFQAGGWRCLTCRPLP
jgi:FkbM family methyltransferase